jgi:hypothetical protein
VSRSWYCSFNGCSPDILSQGVLYDNVPAIFRIIFQNFPYSILHWFQVACPLVDAHHGNWKLGPNFLHPASPIIVSPFSPPQRPIPITPAGFRTQCISRRAFIGEGEYVIMKGLGIWLKGFCSQSAVKLTGIEEHGLCTRKMFFFNCLKHARGDICGQHSKCGIFERQCCG